MRGFSCCLGLLLVACGRDRAAADGKARAPENAAARRPKVALVMKSLANDFFKSMADGAESHQRLHADEYELVVNGIKDESDLGQQVALVEQMIGSGVTAIVIAPADSRALVPVLRRARDRGIVVVNIDNRLDSAVLAQEHIDIPFVGPDNRAGARKVGDVLASRLKQGDEVAILEGIPTAYNGQQRRLGFEQAMREHGMQIVAVQSAAWEQDKAFSVVSAWIRERPSLKAVLASNDNMALGAAAAIRQAGRVGAVQVVGFDNIGAVQSLLRDGRILATADQHADRLATVGIEYALDLIKGKSRPHDRETAVDIIAPRASGP